MAIIKRITAYVMPDGAAHPDKARAIAAWLLKLSQQHHAALSERQVGFLVENRHEVIQLLRELDEAEFPDAG